MEPLGAGEGADGFVDERKVAGDEVGVRDVVPGRGRLTLADCNSAARGRGYVGVRDLTEAAMGTD